MKNEYWWTWVDSRSSKKGAGTASSPGFTKRPPNDGDEAVPAPILKAPCWWALGIGLLRRVHLWTGRQYRWAMLRHALQEIGRQLAVERKARERTTDPNASPKS